MLRLLGRAFLIVALALVNLTCSVNILENFADKTTNAALYTAAKKLINSGDYDAALAKLALITGSFATDRSVIGLKASAYGGKCGISYLTFVENLANMGTTKLFAFLMGQFRSATSATIDACTTAQDLMVSIGAVGTRTSDENMFLLVISFAKIGNILAFYADSDHDGALDAGFTEPNTCTLGGTRGAGNDFADADVVEMGVSTALALEQLQALSGTINLGSSSLTTLTTLCSTLAGAPFNTPICTMTTNASWTDGSNDNLENYAMRTLVNEGQDIGINTCPTVGGDAATCPCP